MGSRREDGGRHVRRAGAAPGLGCEGGESAPPERRVRLHGFLARSGAGLGGRRGERHPRLPFGDVARDRGRRHRVGIGEVELPGP